MSVPYRELVVRNVKGLICMKIPIQTTIDIEAMELVEALVAQQSSSQAAVVRAAVYQHVGYTPKTNSRQTNATTDSSSRGTNCQAEKGGK